MSWGTSYMYEGYLSHIGKRDINSKREECKKINDMMWSEILAYMAMTPPVYAKDDEGNEYPWAEFVAMKLRGFRDEIEETMRLQPLNHERQMSLSVILPEDCTTKKILWTS